MVNILSQLDSSIFCFTAPKNPILKIRLQSCCIFSDKVTVVTLTVCLTFFCLLQFWFARPSTTTITSMYHAHTKLTVWKIIMGALTTWIHCVWWTNGLGVIAKTVKLIMHEHCKSSRYTEELSRGKSPFTQITQNRNCCHNAVSVSSTLAYY